MRRNDDAKSLGSTTSDETAIAPGAPSSSMSPTDVAKACYALALAVLDGDQERARALARAVISVAVEKAARLS